MKNSSFLLMGALATSLLFPPLVSKARAKASGSIEGTIKVTAPARKGPAKANDSPETDSYGEKKYPSASQSQNAHVLPEEIVVYLEKVKGHYTTPKKHAFLDQQYLQFTHRVLPILKGTTVNFTNHDLVYHNVFSNCDENKEFDLGRKLPGQSGSVKFTKLEDVKVYCEVHSSMKAHILVLQNPYFTVVAPGEKYELSNVPPGTYKLMVWHDYWSPVETKVTVKKGKVTQMDFTLDKAQK